MRSENNTTELEPGYGIPSSLSTMSILKFHQLNQISCSIAVSLNMWQCFSTLDNSYSQGKTDSLHHRHYQIRDFHDWQSFSSRPLCQLTARSYWDNSSELFWIDLARYNPRVATPREVERRDAQITTTLSLGAKTTSKMTGDWNQ